MKIFSERCYMIREGSCRRDPVLPSVSQGTTKNRILKGNLTTPFPFLRVCVCVCVKWSYVLLLHVFPLCSECRRTMKDARRLSLKKKPVRITTLKELNGPLTCMVHIKHSQWQDYRYFSILFSIKEWHVTSLIVSIIGIYFKNFEVRTYRSIDYN